MQEDREGVGEGADQPPIIIKRVVVAAGHHGGAWKVAFADFVTAMMALFMVMWLMAAKDETREAIAGYFNDPKGFGEKYGNGESLRLDRVAVRGGRVDAAVHPYEGHLRLARIGRLVPSVRVFRNHVSI